MNLERYPYTNSNEGHDFEFYSEGANGRIRKLVTITKIPDTEPPVYNLAFGDPNPLNNKLDDMVVTNNKDRDVVLSTVANTIGTFCDCNGNHYIYVEGSTPSRTRLYQMSIAALWDEIRTDFEVYGLTKNEWREFKPYSINYDAFLVKRKKLVTFGY